MDGGELWLPFARSRIKALKATGLAHASQQFMMPDGTTVRVRTTPGHDYISLTSTPDEGYQFFTTGPQVQTQAGTDDSHGFDLYLGHALKVTAVPNKDNPGTHKLKAKAIASTLNADVPTPARPARWRFEADAEEIGGDFPRKYVWQVQAVPEHQYFAKEPEDAKPKHRSGVASSPMMVDSWSQSSPLPSLGRRGSRLQPVSSSVDVEYDVAPSLFRQRSGSPKPSGVYADAPNRRLLGAAAPDADWYKRGAFIKVTHAEYGTRIFSVLTDISNRFYVYPADAELSRALALAAKAQWPEVAASVKTAIPEAFVQSADAPLPDWCRTDPEEARVTFQQADRQNDDWLVEYLNRKPQYIWAFNSTCTKACAVVCEDLPGIALGNGTVPQRGDDGEVAEALPGLVELGLHITITGPNPGDFRFGLSLDREMRATVTKEYVMAADYAWAVYEGETAVTALDDLILLTGGIYHTSSERHTVRSASNVDLDLNAFKGVLTVRNHTQDTVLRTFLVNDTNLPYVGVRVNPAEFYPQNRWAPDYFEARGVLVSYDLRILAFVVQQRLIVQDLSEGQSGSIDARRNGVFRAVQRVLVYAHNALAQEKIMDPDSPLNARLGEVFADTSTDGLHRFPVDDVGLYRYGTAGEGEGMPGQPAHLHTAYRSLDLMRARHDARDKALYWYGPLNVQFLFSGGSVNAGAFLYFNKIANAVRTGPHEAFSVHPNGSWSVTTAPFYYYGGASTDLNNKVPFVYYGSTSMAEQIDPALMKQAMVDIISIRVTAGDGTFEDVRGTHLEMVNQTFGTEWTEQDFLCEFTLSEQQVVVPPTTSLNTERYLIASSKTPGADDVFMVFRSWGHLNGTDVVGAMNPAYLDPRATDYNHEYAHGGPVLRGASLFY